MPPGVVAVPVASTPRRVLTESVRVGVAWDRYTNLGGSPAALIGQSPLPLPVGAAGRGTPSVSTVSTDVDVYSVQLVYRFR